jgi:beta-glucosidase
MGLLRGLLRGGWGFPGYIVSDCNAVTDIHWPHHAAASLPAAFAKSIRAGCDLACDSAGPSLLPYACLGM